MIFSIGQGHLTPHSMVGSGRISNVSETLWLSLLPARMKKFQSKMKGLEWSQHFCHCKFRCSRAANSAAHGRIWQNFKLIRDFMVVLVTFKNEEDLIKTHYLLFMRVLTTLYNDFSDAQGQVTP